MPRISRIPSFGPPAADDWMPREESSGERMAQPVQPAAEFAPDERTLSIRFNLEQICMLLEKSRPDPMSGTVAEKRVWLKMLNYFLKAVGISGAKDWETYLSTLGERAGDDMATCPHCGSFFPKGELK